MYMKRKSIQKQILPKFTVLQQTSVFSFCCCPENLREELQYPSRKQLNQGSFEDTTTKQLYQSKRKTQQNRQVIYNMKINQNAQQYTSPSNKNEKATFLEKKGKGVARKQSLSYRNALSQSVRRNQAKAKNSIKKSKIVRRCTNMQQHKDNSSSQNKQFSLVCSLHQPSSINPETSANFIPHPINFVQNDTWVKAQSKFGQKIKEKLEKTNQTKLQQKIEPRSMKNIEFKTNSQTPINKNIHFQLNSPPISQLNSPQHLNYYSPRISGNQNHKNPSVINQQKQQTTFIYRDLKRMGFYVQQEYQKSNQFSYSDPNQLDLNSTKKKQERSPNGYKDLIKTSVVESQDIKAKLQSIQAQRERFNKDRKAKERPFMDMIDQNQRQEPEIVVKKPLSSLLPQTTISQSKHVKGNANPELNDFERQIARTSSKNIYLGNRLGPQMHWPTVDSYLQQVNKSKIVHKIEESTILVDFFNNPNHAVRESFEDRL